MPYPIERKVVFIVGPTGVGKTALALDLAQELQAEIVSADSRLFYRGMDIGTAKPTAVEQARAPHHLIDVAEVDETWSLALFQRRAFEVLEDIHQRGRLALVVGGSGQYVRALTEGWQVPAYKPDPELRAAIEAWARMIGAQGLHQHLAVLDAQAAGAIDWRNQRRTVRALEVIFKSGRRFSEQRKKGGLPYRHKLIGLKRERAQLYARIDARIEAMLEEGLIEEVRGLLKRGYASDLPAMSAIGYREIGQHLRGELSLEEAVRLIKRRTRQFVRRQANWFKEDDARIRWFEMGAGVKEGVKAYILSEEGWQK